MDVKVNYEELKLLSTQLTTIVDEFENASGRRRELTSDIGRPYDRSELRDRAHDFEGQWDDKRNKLCEGCKAVAKQAQAVAEGWEQFDIDAGSKTEGD